jgi:Lytic polysaccharide mono-oxygenase, cellulose-degrading
MQYALMKTIPLVATLLVAGSLPSAAHAHIKLLKPASWVTTDATGNPQKLGPCGTAAAGSGATNAVTTFKAGEEITVEWSETIDHPGHFRIALAKNRDELKDPELKPAAGSCDYPAGSVPTDPHGNVLLDNLFPTSAYGGMKAYSQRVKLPNEPCEKCTLQVLQWMTKHAPSCLYYQCADIKIVAADGAAAGSGAEAGSGPAAGSGAAAGSAAGSPPAPASEDEGGCSVRRVGHERSTPAFLLLLLGAAALTRLRRA